MITLKKKNHSAYEILDGEISVGAIIFNDEYETRTYLENVDVYEVYRNKGIGTTAIKMFAKTYREKGIYFAPDNADAKRLYDRIAEEMDIREYDEYGTYVDQGYGVYVLD